MLNVPNDVTDVSLSTSFLRQSVEIDVSASHFNVTCPCQYQYPAQPTPSFARRGRSHLSAGCTPFRPVLRLSPSSITCRIFYHPLPPWNARFSNEKCRPCPPIPKRLCQLVSSKNKSVANLTHSASSEVWLPRSVKRVNRIACCISSRWGSNAHGVEMYITIHQSTSWFANSWRRNSESRLSVESC